MSYIQPKKRIEVPVFITGCGRSGTTILGLILSKHPFITYLNEPRRIWHSAYPQTDIWSPQAPARKGQLYLDHRVLTPWRTRKLKTLFLDEMLRTGRARLVEKLPENNFRLNFLRGIFPDALFVHIIRNGLHVAHSIERACKEYRDTQSPWFGINEYKWTQLLEYASAFREYQHLPNLCQTDFDRGLLEWRLSVEAALKFCASTQPSKHIQLRYEELVESPVLVLEKIKKFIEVPPSKQVNAFAQINIKRGSSNFSVLNISENSIQIAGDLLERLGYLKLI